MRFSWIIALLMACSTQVNASVEQDLRECQRLTQDTARLSCYDQLVSHLQTNMPQAIAKTAAIVPPKATAPITQQSIKSSNTIVDAVIVQNNVDAKGITSATQPTATEQVQDFGIKYKKVEKEVTEIFLNVKALKKNPRGILTITLDNDQVWRQLDSQKFRLKVGQKVYVRKGALGSFLLGRVDRNASIRVKRVN